MNASTLQHVPCLAALQAIAPAPAISTNTPKRLRTRAGQCFAGATRSAACKQLRIRVEPVARDANLLRSFLIPPRPAWRNGEMSILPCSKCSGEGSLYASRYGGNDPDVWRTGKCDACDGSGNEVCSSRGCDEPAVAFNDDGDALCEDCLSEWTIAGNESEGHYP